MTTILSGLSSYAIRAALQKAVQDFALAYGDGLDPEMYLERLDGEEAGFERMQEALQSLPFLVGRKLVVLNQPGFDKVFAEKAAHLLLGLPETTDLLIVEPKLDKRSAYYKLLKKQPGYQEFPELDGNGLAHWLVDAAKAMQVSLLSTDARYLVERVGPNQEKLFHELEKLALTGKKIDHKLIDEQTAATPQSSIFQLLEAAFAGNLKRTLELYGEQRALKVDPQQIIAMLAWQLHVLALVKTAGQDYGSEAIAREAKLSPYVVKKSASIARGLSLSNLKQLISDLTTIDERLKQESLDADEVLLEYLVRLAQ